MPPISRSLWLRSAAIATVIAASLPAAAQQVGVNSAVNPSANSAAPGQTEKQMLVGENVVFNEHINTGADGQTQILFVDESAMSIGPNSDMTIDEFVFDPKSGSGTEALSATRGVFRYVGGKLSKSASAVTIKTPVATIGIRGGVFLMDLDGNGNLEVVFLYGRGLTVTGLNGVTETITRPGFGLTVHGRGGAPSRPTQTPKSTLASFISHLDGRSGSSGGSSQPPSDTTVANSGISDTLSGNLTNSIQQAIQSQAATQPQTTPTTTSNLSNTLNLNTTVSQNQAVITNPSSPPNNPTGPSITGISGGAVGDNTASNSNGFTDQLTPYSNASVQNGVFMANIGSNQVTFNIAQGTGTLTGNGTLTPSGPIAGTAVITPDGTFFYANAHLVSDPSKVGFIYGGTPVAQSAYATPGTPQFLAFQLQPDGVLQSPVPFVPNQFGGSIPNPTVSPLYLAVSPNTGFGTDPNSGSAFPKALQASLAINGTGANQSSVLMVAVGNAFSTTGNPGQTMAMPVLNGVAEGSYRANGTSPSTLLATSYLTGIDGVGNSFYGNKTIEGFVVTPNNCCNDDGSQVPSLASAVNTQTGTAINYGFVQPALAVATPAIANGPQTAQSLTGFIGGTMTETQNGVSTPYAISGGAVIATDPTNLQILAVLGGTNPFAPRDSGSNSVVLSYGSLDPGNTAARQGYINDNLFGALESPGGSGSTVNGNNANSANLYLVNANAVPNATLLPATGLCQCQYLQWGYWGGTVDTGSGSTERVDIAHINTWVAGNQTPAADISNLISMSANASYSGNAIGTVNNNGASYLASGAFSQTYNFGTQTGVVAINNFDGKSFGGTVTGSRSAPVFSGVLSGSNVSGTTSGFFFGPKAAETGGNFAVQSITGLPYTAAGVFAGKQTTSSH